MPVENQKPEDRPRMPPKVSVIIPLYNSARFIKNTLQSVADQTYKNVEILCVDDGSTDATKDVIAAHFPGVHYLYQNNKGPAAARNLGIKKATGDYIAFLDSDDIWLPEKLALQMERIFNNNAIKLVHTNIHIKINGRLINTAYPTEHQEGRIFENLLLQNGSVVCSTLLAKKECFDTVGDFDEELRSSEDVHLFLRLAHHYDFYFVDKPLVIKHHHDANLTNPQNLHAGAGTILALEKIEQLFPQYCRKTSKVMRQALQLRARMKAAALAQKGDYNTALRLLLQAFGYHKTARNFISISKQIIRMYAGRAGKALQQGNGAAEQPR